MELTLTVEGQRAGVWTSPPGAVSAASYGDGDEQPLAQVLSGKAAALLIPLLDQAAPCKLTTKVRATWGYANDILQVDWTWTGELVVTLGSDGSVMGSGPSVLDARASVFGVCTGGGTFPDSELRVAGSYDGQGGLTVTQLEVSYRVAAGWAVCDQGSAQQQFEPASVAFLAAPLTVALTDGTVVLVPQPDGIFANRWEVTLELAYPGEDGGPAVSRALALGQDWLP